MLYPAICSTPTTWWIFWRLRSYQMLFQKKKKQKVPSAKFLSYSKYPEESKLILLKHSDNYLWENAEQWLDMIPSYWIANKSPSSIPHQLKKLSGIEWRQLAIAWIPPPKEIPRIWPPILHTILTTFHPAAALISVSRTRCGWDPITSKKITCHCIRFGATKNNTQYICKDISSQSNSQLSRKKKTYNLSQLLYTLKSRETLFLK